MKRRVALFANGWANEYMQLVLEGIRKRAAEDNIDIFAFVNYSSGPENKPENINAKAIFQLPDVSQFEGVILLGNTINLNSEREYLARQIQKHNVPSVSLEYEMDGIPFLGTETYTGVYDLVTHLIQGHKAKDFVFVSGPTDNQESQLRLKATVDAMKKAGLRLSPSNILKGEWSYFDTYDAVIAWMNTRNNKLPDVFVCANDEMAIAVCSALDNRGFRVPQDAMVTGCDCIATGQQFSPILSTVARGWDKVGYDGMDLLVRQMNGEEVPTKTTYPSYAVIGESCGCSVDEERQANRLRSVLNAFRGKKESSVNEWHFRFLDEVLAKLDSITELKVTMNGNFAYDHSFEGANFMICIVDDFFSADEIDNVVNNGAYTENMETYVHLVDGMPQWHIVYPSKQLLAVYDGETPESHLYMFLPLHTDEKCVGYAVFIDEVRSLYEQTLYTWARHLSQDLDRVRQNIRLEVLNQKLIDISMTDPLTGLRNRSGCESIAFPYLQKCQQDGKTGAMIFADINRMKMINDKYGHLHGDIALCTVADAIKKTLPQDWIAVRYGGDEFIMVGECHDISEAEDIKNELAANLEVLKGERNLVFPLTVSFGAVVMHPGETYSPEEYLRKADESMYIMKQHYHQIDGMDK